MKIAVVGATGLVGGVMTKVMEERNFPVTDFIAVASEKSVGKEIKFKGRGYRVVGIKEAVAMKPKIAIFSAGGATSLEWAPKFADAGTIVIDKYFKMNYGVTAKIVKRAMFSTKLRSAASTMSSPFTSVL